MEIARKAAVNNVRDILKNTAIPPLPRGSEAEIGPHVTGALPPSHGSQPTAAPSRKIVPDAGDRCETVHTKLKKSDQASPFAPAPLQSLRRYYGLLRPCAPLRYSRPRGWSRCCSGTVLVIRHLSMGHSQSRNRTRFGQGLPAVSCRGGDRRMRGMVAQMLEVGSCI